jgi:hypothetical protein
VAHRRDSTLLCSALLIVVWLDAHKVHITHYVSSASLRQSWLLTPPNMQSTAQTMAAGVGAYTFDQPAITNSVTAVVKPCCRPEKFRVCCFAHLVHECVARRSQHCGQARVASRVEHHVPHLQAQGRVETANHTRRSCHSCAVPGAMPWQAAAARPMRESSMAADADCCDLQSWTYNLLRACSLSEDSCPPA